MKQYIKLPIKIITKKLARNKTDSIFYAGKDIAKFKVGNREYVLTTAGEYKFYLPPPKSKYSPFGPTKYRGPYNEKSSYQVRHLTDKIIKQIGQDDRIDNWGWFGINLWVDNQCQDIPTDAYSTYDEAMEAFISFIQKDLGSK
jgi:hypothetical protein